MELLELQEVTAAQWLELGAEEPGAWGGGPGEALQWREKERHLALREPDGPILATAEAVIVELAVAGSPTFELVGIGGVFVRTSARGRGLMRRVVGELLDLARGMGPERAMLFCRPHLVPVYGSFGFTEIGDPVFAEQPDGPVEVPMGAMWLALHGRPGWPSGRVDVQGLPF
jgi:predicted GNAT family N-acyltransferase